MFSSAFKTEFVLPFDIGNNHHLLRMRPTFYITPQYLPDFLFFFNRAIWPPKSHQDGMYTSIIILLPSFYASTLGYSTVSAVG